MFIFLYHSTCPPGIPKQFFHLVDVSHFFSQEDEHDYLYIKSKEEFFADKIARSLDNGQYSDVKAVVIDKNLHGDGWSRAIRIAGHIVTTTYQYCQLNKLPIILADDAALDLRDQTLASTAISHPFQDGGFYFRTYEQLFTVEEDLITGNEEVLRNYKDLASVDYGRLKIIGQEGDRHQSTNEWGAMRLAHNFGYAGEISFSYPRHLYFKSLVLSLETSSKPQDASLHNLFTKVLLLDDNADQGWTEVLNKIFNCQVDSLNPTLAGVNWQETDFGQYDLILLDLYLQGVPDLTLSLKILELTKTDHPDIPLVIFTASEKALNFREVMDKGADEVYIKESPVHFRDEDYSKKNYDAFKRTILSVYRKYQILRPYWKTIQSILASPNFAAILNGSSNNKFKDRLEERLKMFYGLLKKGYEQSSYDKETFFYSGYKIAFMTLWSTLNDIQAYRYNKTFSSSHIKWKLISDGSEYINYRTTSPSFHTKKQANSLKMRIALQIGFIITKMAPASEVQLQTDLTRLNTTRNKLYLTHGDDDDSANFFSLTEEAKDTSTTITPQGDILDLFNVVSYLLSGDESLRFTL